MTYEFDRFLRYTELRSWLDDLQRDFPSLVSVECIGKSHEGREIPLVTVTDRLYQPHDEKPAHWVDANIHSTECTAGVAACYLIQYLLTEHSVGNAQVVQALKTRTFYIVPRVNPDGVEAALRDRPLYLRSSTRRWPWTDGPQFPGHVVSDIDGDGKVLSMRVKDDHGAWVPHPEDNRVMVPFDDYEQFALPCDPGVQRYRLLREGFIEGYDGFTIPKPAQSQALDLNRNFPAGWGKEIKGSGDHALSEPETRHLVAAMANRPNICGYNAFHTAGGVLLRPSGTQPDSELPPTDLWVWKEIGAAGSRLTGCPVHSCYEDFTWDKKGACMSGCADDFAYYHLGLFSWTTEFWDVIHAATGQRASTHTWYLGPSGEQELAIARWADKNAPGTYCEWRPFNHPQLGTVELGGADKFRLITNPPPHLMLKEVEGHAAFALHQCLLSPKLEILMTKAEPIGVYDTIQEPQEPSAQGKMSLNEYALGIMEKLTPSTAAAPLRTKSRYIYRISVGVANTGFLPTNVTEMASKMNAVLPVQVSLETEFPSPPPNPCPSPGASAELNSYIAKATALFPADGHSPLTCTLGQGGQGGQLAGRLSTRINWGGSDGTPDRALLTWLVVVGPEVRRIRVRARHPRAGTSMQYIALPAHT